MFYSTYTRQFKRILQMFDNISTSLKERKILIESGSTLFYLQNKNGQLKVYTYYLYILSQVVFQLVFLSFLLIGLEYNVEATDSIYEKLLIYFSRPLDQTFPAEGRCDYSSCTSAHNVRVEQLTCQIPINVHLEFIIPGLIATTFLILLYGLVYLMYFLFFWYDSKCQRKKNCSDCKIHPKHCSQKYKLLQYINYPIIETKKTTIAMDTLKIHDVISLIILSRDMDLLNFSIFFENYLIKKNTNAAAINSLTPDLSNL